MMKILNVVESSFRTLVEEQDDTILWLTQTMQKAGAEISVLLSGNGSFYPFVKSSAPPLNIGNWKQQSPADVSRDIRAMAYIGIDLFVVREDIEERKLNSEELPAYVSLISRKDIAGLYQHADTVWHW